MKKIKFLLMSMVAAVLVSCGTTSTVPITGRKQNLMVSDGEMLSLSTQQYQEFMKTAKLSTDATKTAMVKRVGQNLANAVVSYLRTMCRTTSGSLTWWPISRPTHGVCLAD